MPTGESSAVQKWNSCGVFGLRSVATTRPSGVSEWSGAIGESIMRRDTSEYSQNPHCSHDGAKKFLAVAHPVHHLVPPSVGKRDRRDLGEDPARYFVGAIRDAVVAARGRRRHLDAHQTPHWIMAAWIANAQIPTRHAGPLGRRHQKHARTLGIAEAEDDRQGLAARVERSMTLDDADRARRARDRLRPADPG